MAKKKSVKKAKQKVSKSSNVGRARKFKVVSRHLMFYAILFVISLVLYIASNNEMYVNLFWMLSFLFGFLSLAFLILVIIFFLLKNMKK